MEAATNFPHLANAPVTEAVIDFRIKPAEGFSVEAFKGLKAVLSDEFPQIKETKTMQLKFKVGGKPEEQVPQQKDLGVAGYDFHSADEKFVLQFRRDAFTFHRLAPYTSWDEIFSKASKLWKMYVELTHPVDVMRIGTRHVNRVKIPLPVSDLSEYLTALPTLPPQWPQILSGFVSKVAIHEPDKGIMVNVTQVLENPTNPDHVPLILDIDAYRLVVFNGDYEEPLAAFAELRTMKNRIFFSSLTPNALKMFQ